MNDLSNNPAVSTTQTKPKSRNRKPGRPPYLADPRTARKGEKIGGGFFVFRRGRKAGRVQTPEWPFEHPTMEAAQAEVDRLMALFPHERFEIFARFEDRLGG